MTLKERVDYLEKTFELLESTSSRIEKESIVQKISPEMYEDFYFCLEIIVGRRKIGWTYEERIFYSDIDKSDNENMTVKEFMSQLFINEKSETNKYLAEINTGLYAKFIEPIVNRKWKLGIGPSLFEKEKYSPMLAKKFDTKYLGSMSTLTEKLDGNRCIAYYENGWRYKSRNGKDMNVEFDMSNLDTRYIYDGEVLSPTQVKMSDEIVEAVRKNTKLQTAFDVSFNKTSGLINRKSGSKDLIYNIFDIIAPMNYISRRVVLDKIKNTSNVRVLPVLARINRTSESYDKLFEILDIVTSAGGEGLMLNNDNAYYSNKRTSDLLKLKKQYSMDMKVDGIEYGTGKYDCLVGALCCSIYTEGIYVSCKVGTGFTDLQREQWALNPNEILGKIIEVEYFSMSQDKTMTGTNQYSLRFPRYKQTRKDKNTTSID